MAILNFGSINIDYVYRVKQIARPGETIDSLSLATFAGGKGENQSVAMARAGVPVVHLGRIGPEGAWLLDKLGKEGVDTRLIVRGDQPTGHALIQVAESGENAIVLFGGANREIRARDIDTALAGFSPGDWLLTQNETSHVAFALGRAHDRGLKVCFNPAPFGEEVRQYPLAAVDVLFVNETEAAGLLGKREWQDADLAGLAVRFPSAELVVTLGARGVSYRSSSQELTVAGEPVTAVDTTAAGDTFIGYFLACRSKGLAAEEALRIANKAAAICVSRPGAMDSIPAWKEVAGG